MDYDFDIFVSYRRRGNIPHWVRSVFVPELKGHLDEYLSDEVRIAVDSDILECGDDWPTRLSEAHARSKIFVVVLSANYFRSGWCMSEWRNAVDREQILAEEEEQSHEPLVVPIHYNDLKDEDLAKLPQALEDEVRRIEPADFRDYTQLVNRRGDNDRAFEFRLAIEHLCEQRLRHSIRAAPQIRDWPRLPVEPYTSVDPRWRSHL